MATHGPLSRTNTAPVFSSTRSAQGLNQTMSHNSRSSQLSGSTAFTSSSSTSLSSMTSSATLVPPPNSIPGNVVATNNIINQRADASRSLYQICMQLSQRLEKVPDYEQHVPNPDSEDEEEDIDPVSSLWRCLRKGTPLLAIYNAIKPAEPLWIDENTPDARKPKIATFKFVKACLEGTEFKLPAGECFTIQDLFGDDTTGFVKVTQVINIVLDIAQQRGHLITSDSEDPQQSTMPGSQMSYRDHVVRELVDTERKYVQDLENLYELKKTVEQKGVVPGDVVHDIFLNINAILDFQRRFLIRIETTNSQPDEKQEWGLPFSTYEEAFSIYQPFIANQRKAASIAKRDFSKLAQADHPVVVDFNTLDGFLLKPMQRLVKYPLLLKDLRDKTNADEDTKAELSAGIDAANRVLHQANAAVDREIREEALKDLRSRVDDWKNHQVDHFGELLLHGHFPVVTGKSDVQKEVRPRSQTTSFESVLIDNPTFSLLSPTSKRKALAQKWLQPNAPTTLTDAECEVTTENTGIETNCSCCLSRITNPDLDDFLSETICYETVLAQKIQSENDTDMRGECPFSQQYTIYLFERILLCCKELNPNKSKDKLMGTQKDKSKKDKTKNKEPNKNAKLQLKGRIFMTNVTEVVSLSKQGSYSVQIFWKGDPGVENFIIRFSNEEAMKKWYAGVDGQRKEHASNLQSGSSPDAPRQDFAWNVMQGQQNIQNPYAQQDDEDEEEDDYYQQQNSDYGGQQQSPPGLPRNASSSSLRARSATAESSQSLAGIVRAAPPRFPMGLPNPPLSLQTQLTPGMPSPGQRGGDSYFSPVAESPASSSRTSTQSSVFPFPRQGTPSGHGWEENTRYTAPAMPRAPSRGSQTPADAYQMVGRNAQRPSLPAMSSQQAQIAAQQRSRSYSTPDINGPNGRGRPPNAPPSGPVPAVPGIPPHLHPAYDAGIPRSQNSSPNGLPMRANTQSPGVQRERLGANQQYTSAPAYNRSNTTQIPLSVADNRTISPPNGSRLSGERHFSLPTQLKVKVNYNEGPYVTLVVAFNITYQSLIDRIDAKIGRISGNTIGRGTMRLRYLDEDRDYVTIESDDDIQIAFTEWWEAHKSQYHTGQLGEIELFCLSHAGDN